MSPLRSSRRARSVDPDGARRSRKAALASAITTAASVVATGIAVTGAAAYFARRIVSPTERKPDDVQVLAVGAGTITFRETPDTLAPGRYGLWLDGGEGHARVGPVIDHDAHARSVTRELVAVDNGRLKEGPARWNQYYFAGTPASALGLSFTEVGVSTERGDMPAWVVPPAPGVPPRETWAVLVHGRGASREECLRALPLLHRLGFTSLVISYRNDSWAPNGASGSYHLGDAEWVDLEQAVLHALAQGAKDVVLLGWSMGGAIVLQYVARSWSADRVRALVLDAPVVDWRDVLAHHARLNRLPQPVGRLGQAVLEHPQARRFAGLDAPLSLDRMDWVTRASELRLPVLLIHSDDDDFVPSGPSRRLAEARPDIVTFVPSRGAAHTREWNVDPEGWDTAVARFLLRL